MLAEPAYFQAIFHSLPKVTELYQNQADLGLANETIASESALSAMISSGLM
jgi:ESCRT-I complex subunit VPS37